MAKENTLGKRIKQLRSKQNLSLSEVARRANVSKASMSQIESGNTKRPSVQILTKIATALDVDLSELIRTAVYGPLGFSCKIEKLNISIPQSLREFAHKEQLGAEEIEMLAGVTYKGKQPLTVSDWRFLFEAIKRSVK